MKSQKLLDEIMRLDNIVDVKIYRINDNSSDLLNNNIQTSFSYFVKNVNANNRRTDKVENLFM